MLMSEMDRIYDLCEERVWKRVCWEYKNKEYNKYWSIRLFFELQQAHQRQTKIF